MSNAEDDIDITVAQPWAPGEAVGRYTLLAKIAVGGMAEIWLARQAGPRGFEKVVVIKRIIDSYSHDPEFVEMFLDEARIAAQLNHANIVQILDLGEHRSAWYIAMESLAGENVAVLMRAARKQSYQLPLPVVIKIIAMAAEGLSHAHDRSGPDGKPLNVVHRDVSPQNIVVTYDGQVKVVDFGIAKAASRGFNTAVGKVRGKFSYMAPEQAQGAPLDARADIFALGVVAYEVATGARLFKSDDPASVLNMVLAPEPIPLASEKNPDVPEDLAQVLAKALERRREDRYQTAQAFGRALDGWLARQGMPGSSEIAAQMQSIFASRIKSRSQLIESASRGELTPSGASHALRADTGPSMPSVQLAEVRQPAPARAQRRPGLVVGAVVALAVLAGGGYLLARPTEPVAEPPPKTAAAPKATLTISTTPAGAAISIDGAEAGKTPLSLDDLAPGEHLLVATLAGHQPAEQKVTLARGEKASVALALAAAPAPTAPVAVTPDPEPDKKQPTRAAPKGKLRLNTNPWTRVSLGSRQLGETPLIEVPLPAGRHQLKLVNEEKKINKTIEVEIKPGQTTVKQLAL